MSFAAQTSAVAFSYRDDPTVPAFPDDHPVVVFDGTCRMCSGFARFVLRHDRRDVFRFIAAQSSLGTALYRHYGLDATRFETFIVLEAGLPFVRSEGAFRLFRGLGVPWSLVQLGRALPLTLRDRLYDVIARNRLRWFGTRATCYLLEPRQEHKFLG